MCTDFASAEAEGLTKAQISVGTSAGAGVKGECLGARRSLSPLPSPLYIVCMLASIRSMYHTLL